MHGPVRRLELLLVGLPVRLHQTPAQVVAADQRFGLNFLPGWDGVRPSSGQISMYSSTNNSCVIQIVVRSASLGSSGPSRLEHHGSGLQRRLGGLPPRSTRNGCSGVWRKRCITAGRMCVAALRMLAIRIVPRKPSCSRCGDLFKRLECVQGIMCVLEDGLAKCCGCCAMPAAFEQFFAKRPFEFVDRV